MSEQPVSDARAITEILRETIKGGSPVDAIIALTDYMHSQRLQALACAHGHILGVIAQGEDPATFPTDKLVAMAMELLEPRAANECPDCGAELPLARYESDSGLLVVVCPQCKNRLAKMPPPLNFASPPGDS